MAICSKGDPVTPIQQQAHHEQQCAHSKQTCQNEADQSSAFNFFHVLLPPESSDFPTMWFHGFFV